MTNAPASLGGTTLSEPAAVLVQALAALPADRMSGGLLLAVSGGPDSLALLLAAAELAAHHRLKPPLHVATVDHALRADSAREAEGVAAICRGFGVAHRILTWRHGGTIHGNLSGEARSARYRLLSDEARRVGAGLVATAHHRDDQIETHLLARARGASGGALAGMRPWRDLEPGQVLFRPFLALPKAALSDHVRAAGLVAVDDPSNRDRRFARARLRLERRGDDLTASADLEAARLLRKREDDDVAAELQELWDRDKLAVSARGEITIECAAVSPALLSRAVTAAGGGRYPPARAALEALAVRMLADRAGAATLGGCRIVWGETGLRLAREYGRVGPPALRWDAEGASTCFDNRFDIPAETGARAWRAIVAYGGWGRGPLAGRTLPVAIDEDGEIVAAHPLLSLPEGRDVPRFAVSCRVAWRLVADLVLPARLALTGGPQNAANRGEPVGKGLASTYIRRQVEASCVARRVVARAHFQDG